MEEKSKEHNLSLDNRKRGTLSGIIGVESFDEEEAVLRSEENRIVIKGQGLHVTKLDIARGQIEFEGLVDLISYQKINSAKNMASGIVKRLFK